jgi:hypothetical protein
MDELQNAIKQVNEKKQKLEAERLRRKMEKEEWDF